MQRMLRIHKRRQPAGLLRLGHNLQRDRRLTRRLRPEDLNNPAPRHAAHSQRRIERDRPRRDDRNRHNRLFGPQPHHRSLAKLLFQLRKGGLYSPGAVICHVILLFATQTALGGDEPSLAAKSDRSKRKAKIPAEIPYVIRAISGTLFSRSRCPHPRCPHASSVTSMSSSRPLSSFCWSPTSSPRRSSASAPSPSPA